MDSSSTKALKSGVWYTISNFVVKGAVFLTTPIFTRLLSQSDVGDFSNLSSWISLLMIVTTFELFSTVGLARYDFQNELDDYTGTNLLFGSSITLLFYIGCLVFKDAALSFFSFSELELHVAFCYLLTHPALAMYQGRKQITYQYKTSVTISLTSMLSAVLISLISVLLASESNKLTARIIGYYGPLIILNLGIFCYILYKTKHIRLRYFRYAIKLSLPMLVHLLASNLLSTSDRVMIRNMCGSSTAALYTVAYNSAVVVSVLWQSMNSAWSPWAYEMLNKENYSAMRKASKPYILVFGFVSFAFLLIAPEMLWLMGGPDYMIAVNVIPPVLCGFVLHFVYSLYVNIEYYYKKQHYIAIGTIIAAAVNVTLNFICIPHFGYIAAAYTTLIGYFVLLLLHYFLTTRVLKKNYIFDSKFIFAFVFLFFVITLLGMVLYQHTLIRYSIIACFAVVFLVAAFVLRKEIMVFMKTRSLRAFTERFSRS